VTTARTTLRRRAWLGLAPLALLALLALLATPPPAISRTAVSPVAATTCGPPPIDRVVGQRPSYLPRELSRLWGDGAICRARWLGGAAGRFVPQSIAVDGATAFVSGYDDQADAERGQCRVMQLELPSLRVVVAQKGLGGRLPNGATALCGHAGGVVVDDADRLWVTDTNLLFLLDRTRLGTDQAVRRVWRLDPEVRGSTGLFHPAKGLGLGRYATDGSGRFDWYDPDTIIASSSALLEPSATEPVLNGLQGAAHGRLRSTASRATWRTHSGPGCGVLLGPGGQRVPVARGIEGLAFGPSGRVWMLSETSVRKWWDEGEWVIPQVLGYSAARLDEQTRLARGRRLADDCLARIG
jgi:hypothetical protein